MVTVLLMASSSNSSRGAAVMDEMVSWVSTNAAALGGRQLLAAPVELADSLLQTQQLSLNPRLQSMTIQKLQQHDGGGGDLDVVIASKILNGEIQAVVFFKDHYSNSNNSGGGGGGVILPDVDLLSRVCSTANIPLALNRKTADFILRGVARTRVAYLIFNPAAGQGHADLDLQTIRDILEPTLILHVVLTEKDRDVGEQAKEIVQLIQASSSSSSSPDHDDESDHDDMTTPIIIGSGGDGTVSAVAGATLGSGLAFAAIPRGTANAFSVALGIPTPPGVDQASRNILTGQVRVIDGGVVYSDDKKKKIPFINLAGVGFEAGLVSNATRELKDVFGNLAYMLGGAQQALEQKPFECELQIDNQEKQTLQTKVITVANVAPPSSVFAQGFGKVIPDDGFFEVTVTTGKDAWRDLDALATLWVSSVVKAAVPSESVLRIRAKKITVHCNPPQKLLLDGEVLEMNPVTFEIVPGGLQVITPVDSEK